MSTVTFFPDTALRRTPSSLSRPKNWTNKQTTRSKYTKRKILSAKLKEWVNKCYLWKLNRAATPLSLRFLYKAPTIARKSPKQNQQIDKPTSSIYQVPDPSSNIEEPIQRQATENISISKIDIKNYTWKLDDVYSMIRRWGYYIKKNSWMTNQNEHGTW